MGFSGSNFERVIWLILKGLWMPMFFAYSALCVCKLLIINKLLVEAAGVEPVIGTENTQVTETENA